MNTATHAMESDARKEWEDQKEEWEDQKETKQVDHVKVGVWMEMDVQCHWKVDHMKRHWEDVLISKWAPDSQNGRRIHWLSTESRKSGHGRRCSVHSGVCGFRCARQGMSDRVCMIDIACNVRCE